MTTAMRLLVAAILIAGAAAAGAGEAPAGKTIYQMNCAACHTSGAAGAPKLGDDEAWSPRISRGMPTLYAGAIRGKGGMPPKGGQAGLSDADVRAAVDFIVTEARRAARPADKSSAAAGDPLGAEAARVAFARGGGAPLVTGPRAGDPNAFNRLWTGAAQRNLAPSEDGIHDAGGPGAFALQPPALAFEKLTRSNAGNYVNWVASLGAKQIQPRWDVKAPGEPTVMDLNIVREVKGTMPDVVYPHKPHTEWLDCSNCHPAIFVPQKGANRMSMASIVLGQGCGTCHGKVAFPISECRLCHSKTKDGPRAAAAK